MHDDNLRPPGRGRRNRTAVPLEEPKPEGVDFLRFLTDLRAGLSESLNGLILKGSRPVQIGDVASQGGTQRLSMSPGKITGWAIRNADPANARVINLRDSPGGQGDGPIVAVIRLAGNSTNHYHHAAGVSFQYGLWAEFTDDVNVPVSPFGLSGSVYLGAAD